MSEQSETPKSIESESIDNTGLKDILNALEKNKQKDVIDALNEAFPQD